MPDRLPLARAALAMRAQGPAVWDTFLASLQGYVEEQATALVIAPVEALQTVQGRAQGVRTLLSLLLAAESEVNRDEKKKAKHP